MTYIFRIVVMVMTVSCLVCCQSAQKTKDAGDAKDGATGPKLTKPVVKKIWVPEAIEDDGHVLIEGHFKWLLEKDSTWSR